jgi:hypothetical protein
MNKRKAMIGYATFWVGRRLAQRMVRRQVKRRLAGLLGTGERSAARRRLPIVGALVALPRLSPSSSLVTDAASARMPEPIRLRHP